MKKSLSVLVFLIIRMCCYSQADTSGVYIPIILEVSNITPGMAVPGSTHFIKNGHQVYIEGRCSVTGIIDQGNGARVYFSPSLPFPISTAVQGDAATGELSAVQKGTQVITPGYIIAVPSFLVLCLWNSTATGSASVYYHFTYTSTN
jgi:hypothetical protein